MSHLPPAQRPPQWDQRASPYHNMPQPQPTYRSQQAAGPMPRYGSLPPPASKARNGSRQRWPPSPIVEDEVVSLSREATPVLPELVGREARMRGSVDQQPIIVEANPGAFPTAAPRRADAKSPDSSSLKSRSSTESFGPPTPPDSASLNPDRRFVWQPGKDAAAPPPGQHRPAKSTHPAQPDARREEQTQAPSTSRKPSGPTLDARKPEADRQPKASHESSPYLASPSSARPAFPNDHAAAGLGPDARYRANSSSNAPNLRQEPPGQSRGRASTLTPNRPAFARHASAAAYPGQPMPGSPLYRSPFSPMTPHSVSRKSRETETSSDESEISPDEDRRKLDRKGSIRSSRPEYAGQRSAAGYDEAVHLAQRHGCNAPRPTTPPQRPMSNSWGGPVRDQAYGYGVPETAPLPFGSSTKGPSSPQPSPNTSPRSTPPPSPPADSSRFSSRPTSSSKRASQPPRPSSPIFLAPPPTRKSRSDSRPASPDSHTSHHSKPPGLRLPGESRSGRAGNADAPKPQQTSPLPSPVPEYPAIKPVGVDVQPQRSARNGASSQPIEIPTRPRERESWPAFPTSPNNPSLGLPKAGRASYHGEAARPEGESMKRSADAVPALPMKSPAKKPPTTPRLPLQLPACPRPEYALGHSDWHTLPGCQDFDICPGCRRAIESAGFGGQFQPSVARPASFKIRCDLSIPWVRMAWLLVLRNKAPVRLVHEVMNVIANEPSCPGKDGIAKKWFRPFDPESNKLVSGFDACSSCIGSIEAILPNLQGVFRVAQALPVSQPRSCALRFDSNRFAGYIDLLEDISNQAAYYRRPPNMLRFITLAREMSDVRECLRDDQLRDATWFYIPHLPELTACEECYKLVVWPQISVGSDVAAMFNRNLRLLPSHPSPVNASCQLYSLRMREAFERACRTGDFTTLRARALARVSVERDLQRQLAHVKALPVEVRAAEGEKLVAEWKRWE